MTISYNKAKIQMMACCSHCSNCAIIAIIVVKVATNGEWAQFFEIFSWVDGSKNIYKWTKKIFGGGSKKNLGGWHFLFVFFFFVGLVKRDFKK